jgi:hypothetical protein
LGEGRRQDLSIAIAAAELPDRALDGRRYKRSRYKRSIWVSMEPRMLDRIAQGVNAGFDCPEPPR